MLTGHEKGEVCEKADLFFIGAYSLSLSANNWHILKR
jgi:hypothetical protein